MKKIIFTTILFFLISLSSVYGWPSSLSDWSYRKAIAVNVSDGSTLTDYPILVNWTATGNEQSNFDDLRPMNNCSDDAYELSYWIQDYATSSYANIWIKIPTINSTICMYYGNPSASSGENGTATFPLHFEDSENYNSPLDYWTHQQTGGTVEYSTTEVFYGVNSTKMYTAGGAGVWNEIRRAITPSTNIVVSTRFWDDATDTTRTTLFRAYDSTPASIGNMGVYTGASTTNYVYYDTAAGSYVTTSVARTTGWHLFEIATDGTTVRIYIDGVEVGSYANSNAVNYVVYIEGGGSSSADTWYIDNSFIRKYHDPEPTYIIGGNPPSISITSPTNTTYVFSWEENNTLTFNFSVSGESSSYHVKTYLDGTLKYENTSFGNNDYYSINYTVSTGNHNFSVWVNDTTNDLPSTKEVFFSVLNLNDWSYRKAINISVSSGTTPANYQLPINVTYDPDMLGNFSDLRFVNGSDNYELGYWIENYVSSDWAYVWVKIDQNITTSNYTIYMYYGNPSASSASSGNATFVLFDDFESGTLDNWNVNLGPVVQSTTVYEGNYAVKFAANNGDEIYRDLSDGNYSLTFYAKLTSGDFYGGFNVYPDDYVFALRDGFTYFKIRQQSVVYDTNVVRDTDWHKYRVIINYTAARYYIDDAETNAIDRSDGYPINKTRFVGANTPRESYADLIFLALHNDPEPDYAVGTEESSPTAVISLTLTSPTNTTYVTTTIWINGSSNKNANVTYSIDGGSNQTACENCTSFSNSTTLSDGQHNVTVYVIDFSDASKIDSTTVWFTVDTTPPASITGISAVKGNDWILWEWTKPSDTDFSHTEIWINGTFRVNTSNNFYLESYLQDGKTYEIQTRTWDVNGHVNQTWVNDSATTYKNLILLDDLVDEYNIENKENITLDFTQATKYEGNPIFETEAGTWYSVYLRYPTVYYYEGKFHMWFSGYNSSDYTNHPDDVSTGYMESYDGVTWDSPTLMFYGRQMKDVYYDPYALNQSRKFKCVFNYMTSPNYGGEAGLAYGSNETEWVESAYNRIITGDSTYHEDYTLERNVSNPNGWLIFAKNTTNLIRGIILYYNDTILDTNQWTKYDGYLIYKATTGDQAHSIHPKLYGDVYYGFLYDNYTEDVTPTSSIATLWVSRNAIDWTYKGVVIPKGSSGEWDAAQTGPASKSPVHYGKEWWIYYYGNNDTTYAGKFGVAKTRYEGLTSANVSNAGGYIQTKLINTSGYSNPILVVNVNATGGNLTIELLDENNNTITGYESSNFDIITTDEIAKKVSWSGHSKLPESFKIKFILNEARLYSFKIYDSDIQETLASYLSVISKTLKPSSPIDPIENSNVSMNITVTFENTTTIDTCEVRIMNTTDTYDSPSKLLTGTINYDGTNYYCFAEWNMEYWRNDGTWNVSVDINQSDGTSNFTSELFTYNTLTAMQIVDDVSNFGSLSPGTSLTSSDYIEIKNTGNQVYDVNITGADLVGQTDPSYNISANNLKFDLDSDASDGTTLSTSSQLAISTLQASNSQQLYFYISVPNIKSQSYSNTFTLSVG